MTYGLRPEALSFGSEGLPGTLNMLEPTGPETYAFVDTAVGSLVARVPGRAHHHVGERVFVRWSPEHSHLFDAGSQLRIA